MIEILKIWLTIMKADFDRKLMQFNNSINNLNLNIQACRQLFNRQFQKFNTKTI